MYTFTLIFISCALMYKEVRGLQCLALAATEIEYINNNCLGGSLGEFHAAKTGCKEDLPCSPNCNNTNFFSQVVDNKQGFLEVYYQLPQKDCHTYKSYTITLLTKEGLSEAECDATSSKDVYFETHSCRSFTSEVCNMCNRTVVILFKYVYTGCYYFKIEASDENRIHPSQLIPKQYIVTSYSKSNVTQHKPVFSFNYNGESELEVIVMYPFIPSLSILTLMTDIDPTLEHPCEHSGEAHSSCVTCLDETKVLCYKTFDRPDPKPQCTYYKENNGYSCSFPNIPPMNYCLVLEFEDDRCQQGTVWAKNEVCSWVITNSAVEVINSIVTPALPSEIAPERSKTIFFCSIYLIISLAVIGFIIYKNRNPIKGLINNVDGSTGERFEEFEEFPRVFLIYARDCPLFMDTMSQFRTVLSTMGCEVYDYWDDMRFNEVSNNGTGWVRNLVADKEVRLVYFVTPISHMIEEAYKNPRFQVSYKVPHCFDNLIHYTFTSLAEISTESYKRIFVVRLQNSVESDELTFLNPATSYFLPVHLDKLVHFIKNKPFREFRDVHTLNSLPEVDKFVSLINDLDKSTNNNMYYIYDIINID